MPDIHRAACNCGAVRLTMRGSPKRVGLCHCQTCRKATGSSFVNVAVWDMRDVEVSGETKAWTETVYSRHFCNVCGSPMYGLEADDAGEIDINVGVIAEVPSPFTPSYELWVGRRERWLHAVEGARQHSRNRDAPMGG